jgi:hypothetical protein
MIIQIKKSAPTQLPWSIIKAGEVVHVHSDTTSGGVSDRSLYMKLNTGDAVQLCSGTVCESHLMSPYMYSLVVAALRVE